MEGRASQVRLEPEIALSSLAEGFRLALGDPPVRRRIAGVLVANAVAFLLLVAGLVWGAFAGIEWLLGDAAVDGGWLANAWAWIREGLGWVLRIAAVLGALLVAPPLFGLLASLLLPMLGGVVFEAARRRCGGGEVADAPGMGTAAVRIAATEVRRLLRFVTVSLALLLLHLVPGVGSLLYLVLQSLVSARSMAWDLLAHHFELHGLPHDAQRRFLRDHRLGVLTFGGAALLMAMVPVVQLVFVTTNYAGVGVLSARLDAEGEPGPSAGSST